MYGTLASWSQHVDDYGNPEQMFAKGSLDTDNKGQFHPVRQHQFKDNRFCIRIGCRNRKESDFSKGKGSAGRQENGRCETWQTTGKFAEKTYIY